MDVDQTIEIKTSTGMMIVDITRGPDWFEVKVRVGPERFVYVCDIHDPEMMNRMINSAIQLVIMDAHTTPGRNPTPFSGGLSR